MMLLTIYTKRPLMLQIFKAARIFGLQFEISKLKYYYQLYLWVLFPGTESLFPTTRQRRVSYHVLLC